MIEWRFQQALKEKGIYNASQLEAALKEILGIDISRTALDKLVKTQPTQVRLETMQYLCTLLQTSLDRLLIITPDATIRHPVLIQPFGKKANPAESIMTDPSQFF